MQKIFSRMGNAGFDRAAVPALSRGLSQRFALACGGLCLITAMTLVMVASLSSNYIIAQQELQRGSVLVTSIAADIAPLIEAGDLIRLEVALRSLRQHHQLQQIRVFDVEDRMLSSAGSNLEAGVEHHRGEIQLHGNIAGEVRIQLPAPAATQELQRMSLGLASLAVLLSLFAAALGALWGQRYAARLQAANQQLWLEPQSPQSSFADEIAELECAIQQLPLHLLRRPAEAADTTAEYRHAALLFVHLDSLSTHVETLDEASLLRYTELQRRIVAAACQLYAGKLTVVRQFGLLLSFSDQGNPGSPAFRALSSAWLVAQVARTLNHAEAPRIRLTQACGISETGIGTSNDIYPDLYNQHLVDELATLTDGCNDNILLAEGLFADPEISNRCRLEKSDAGYLLKGFEEPYGDLLERQREMLLRDLRS